MSSDALDVRCDALQRYRKPSTAKKPGWKNVRKALHTQSVSGLEKGAKDSDPRTVHLVGISGFAYAAVAAKLLDKDNLTAPMEYLKLADVLTKLKSVGDDEKAKDQDRANCRRLCVTIETFLELLGSDVEHAHMLFLRDCACKPFGTFNSSLFGEDEKPDAKFRATWTAGWFIERVRRAGVDVEPYEVLSKKKRQERRDHAIEQWRRRHCEN